MLQYIVLLALILAVYGFSTHTSNIPAQSYVNLHATPRSQKKNSQSHIPSKRFIQNSRIFTMFTGDKAPVNPTTKSVSSSPIFNPSIPGINTESSFDMSVQAQLNSVSQQVSMDVPSVTYTPGKNPYDLSPQQFIYVILTSVFITCLIVADVIGVKLFEIPLPFEILGHKTVEHTCGMLTFPITFILGDIINEYYGPKAAKNTVYLGLAMSVLVFFVMNVAQAMPYLDKPFNVSKDSFDAIFGSAKLMYIASMCAYLVGSLSDIWIFGIIKKATNGKLLWLRATGSTVISQVIDSFLVSYIAFSVGKTFNGLPAASLPEVFNIAATGYGLKFCLAASLTPLLYVLKSLLTEKYGLKPIPANAESDEPVM